MKEEGRKPRILRYCIIAVYAVLMIIYFYRTAFLDNDLAVHIASSKTVFQQRHIYSDTPRRTFMITYPLFHILTKLVALLCGGNYELGAAIVLTITNLCLIWLMFRILKSDQEVSDKEWFMVIGLSLIVCLPLLGKMYLPQCSPTIWHNPTYIMQKPFSMIVFFLYLDVLEHPDHTRSFWLLSLFCVLSAIAKPVYMIVFLPAAFLVTVYQLIRYGKTELNYGIHLLLAVLPVIALLLYQKSLTMDGSVTTALGFGTFMHLSWKRSLVAIAAAVFLPFHYTWLYRGKFKDSIMILFAWISYLAGWFEYFFIYEVEFADGNYSWGYSMAIFLLYFAVYKDLRLQDDSKNKKIITAVFMLQILLGVVYFARMLNGGDYSI
ncbi:MAG: hypothetical protein VZT48_04295 [Bulleidia sp.]|nr:hypothetical protein [Bulleidia sp.]